MASYWQLVHAEAMYAGKHCFLLASLGIKLRGNADSARNSQKGTKDRGRIETGRER